MQAPRSRDPDSYWPPRGRFHPNYVPSRKIPNNELNYYGKKTQELGRGSFGVVYKTDGSYAIKKSIDDFNQSFLREVSILIALRHPNIIPIFDVPQLPKIIDNYTDYYVMPAAKMNIHKLTQMSVGKDGIVRVPNLRSIIYQIMSGIAYCHSLGIIHRDIKPENILLFEGGRVCLADFGMARAYACDIAPGRTNLVYTYPFRAPEVFLGEDETIYGSAADVWAAAVTIYYISTGEYLFGIASDDQAQLLRIFKILGTPGFSNVSWAEARDLPGWPHGVPNYFPTIRDKFDKWLNDDIIRLMSNMIVYDPEERATAYDIITNSYFDPVRNEEAETTMDCSGAVLQSKERYIIPATEIPRKIEMVNHILSFPSINGIKMHIKTILLASQYIDEAYDTVRPTAEEYKLYCNICLYLAACISENEIPGHLDVLYDSGGYTQDEDDEKVNLDKERNLRQKILRALQYDLIPTTVYDYGAEFRSSDKEVWALTKALMIVATFTPLRHKMLPGTLFSLIESIVSIATGEREKYGAITDDMVEFVNSVPDDMPTMKGIQNYLNRMLKHSSWLGLSLYDIKNILN